ncbi:MAG TPA: type II toxin-antitoxin system VapC family toxin [Steroidobacteraceae bacterium]|nr:type II toxin-antitoxin system VapC family toxin [Steroidobacteraceae bacterium]
MSVYAESSAVLAWLLDEEPAASVRELLAAQQIVVASDLTLIECERVLHRAVVLGELTEADAADRRAHLTAAAAHWTVLRISPEVVERARQSFPGSPVRTSDAIHLASLLVARSAISGLALLSLDIRVRGAAADLGIQLQPRYTPGPKDT